MRRISAKYMQKRSVKQSSLRFGRFFQDEADFGRMAIEEVLSRKAEM